MYRVMVIQPTDKQAIVKKGVHRPPRDNGKHGNYRADNQKSLQQTHRKTEDAVYRVDNGQAFDNRGKKPARKEKQQLDEEKQDNEA